MNARLHWCCRAPMALALVVLGTLSLGRPAAALQPCEELPPPPVDDPAAARDPATHLAQARLFLKRGWTADAIAELERSRATEAGRENPDIMAMLVEAHLAADALPEALCFAKEAVRLAPERAELARIARSLEQEHGLLRIVGPVEGLVTRMQLDALDPLTSQAEKERVGRVALRLREQIRLPTTVALPVGRYTVNGVETEVVADRDAIVGLPHEATGARGLASLQVTRAEVGAGVLVVPGGTLPELTPTVQLGMTVPAGLLLVGGVLDVQLPTGFTVLGRSEQDRAPPSLTGGLRVGADLLTRLPLAIRPSLVLRAGQLAGAGRACDESGRCGAPGQPGSESDTVVHSMAWVLMPGAELSIDHRQAGRSGAAGFGLKVGAESIFGWLPAEGRSEQAAGAYTWTSGPTRFPAAAVRVLANGSFAF